MFQNSIYLNISFQPKYRHCMALHAKASRHRGFFKNLSMREGGGGGAIYISYILEKFTLFCVSYYTPIWNIVVIIFFWN